jgi:hypothetical protein
MAIPEWRPRNYILQISHRHCIACQSTETSSQLYLVSEHLLRKDVTRRTEAHWIDARLPRGKSERTTSVCTCPNCFEPYEGQQNIRKQDLELVSPGDPFKKLHLELGDL